MSITYRKLIKWRLESLRTLNKIREEELPSITSHLHERILQLTQELIDQYLIRRKS